MRTDTLCTPDLAELKFSPAPGRSGLDPTAAAEPEHKGERLAQQPKWQRRVTNPGLQAPKPVFVKTRPAVRVR